MADKKHPPVSSRRGAIIVLLAVLIVLLLFAVVMVVDVGVMYVVQGDLQAAADGAALAAAGEMSRATTDVYLTNAIEGARMYAAQHASVGMDGGFQLADADIQFGDADFDEQRSTWTFMPDSFSSAPYAVRVTVRRDGETNPLVPRFFAGIFGSHHGTQSATAAAMITPRDIALVVDLSQSMTFDSMLIHRNDTQINLRDVWVTLDGPADSPSTKFISGAGEFITEYELSTPDTSVYAGRTGQTFRSMAVWGTTIYHGQYNQAAVQADPGLYYLPPSGGWSLGGPSDPRYQWLVEDLSNPYSLKSREHTAAQINGLLNPPSSSSYYRRHVKVLLGLATWNDYDGDNSVDSNEVSDAVSEPYVHGQGWDDWIDDVRNASGLTYSSGWGGASYFRYRYGLKTYVNWLMDCQFAKDYPVPGSSGYTPQLQFTVAEPLQAVKDAVDIFADYLKSVESNDKAGMVVYGTNSAADPFSQTNGLTNDFDQVANLPYPHQAGEHGRYTNTAEPIVRAYQMVHGPGSRPHAHKVIVFMSDGYTNVHNHFNYMTDLEDPSNIDLLRDVQSIEDFEDLIGGFPSSNLTIAGSGSDAGREETLWIARMLASNYLALGSVEFNVVGVGADADIMNLLQPLAEASGGDAYYAAPDLANPQLLPELLKDIYRRIGGKRPVALIRPSPSAN